MRSWVCLQDLHETLRLVLESCQIDWKKFLRVGNFPKFSDTHFVRSLKVWWTELDQVVFVVLTSRVFFKTKALTEITWERISARIPGTRFGFAGLSFAEKQVCSPVICYSEPFLQELWYRDPAFRLQKRNTEREACILLYRNSFFFSILAVLHWHSMAKPFVLLDNSWRGTDHHLCKQQFLLK